MNRSSVKHIVHAGPALFPEVLSVTGGAIQRRMWETARRQSASGHEVTVYSIGETRRTIDVEGVRLEYLPPRSTGVRRQLAHQRAVIAHMQQSGSRPDLIHCHSLPEFAWLARGLSAPTMLSFDEFHFRRGRRTPLFLVVRAMLRRFTHLLPVSEYCRQESARYWRIPASEMQVLYNGVNCDQFRPLPDAGQVERDRAGLQAPVALYVGRLNRQKGTHVLIEAARILRDRNVNVRVVAAGPIGQFDASGTEPAWDGKLREVGGVYLGLIPESRLAAVYSAATVFVMPTIMLEMFGMAAVEAQACGCPAIATDHGGLRETVTAEGGGIRVPTGDAEALAAAIEHAVCDSDNPLGRSAAARRFASRFDWKHICQRIEALAGWRVEAAPKDARNTVGTTNDPVPLYQT